MQICRMILYKMINFGSVGREFQMGVLAHLKTVLEQEH